MSENAFNFNSAPNSKMGRQFVAFGGLKKAFGIKPSNGVSAKDQSALMRQQTAHNIDTAVVKHVLGEIAAESAHTRSEKAAGSALGRTKADREHAVNLSTSNVPKGHVVSGMSFPGGSAKYSQAPKAEKSASADSPQFTNVTGNTSGQSAVNLD